MVRREKIIARELAIEVGALAEATEIILRERTHEWILAIPEARISVEVWKVHTSVAVHDINNNCDSVLVGDIDHLLEVGSFAEPFVYAEIPDRKIAPVDRRGDVRERHHLDSIHAEVS